MSVSPRAEAPNGIMTRDAYLEWADGRPGRYERVDGRVVAMAPEQVRHSRIKGEVFVALREAVAAAGLPCEVLMEGPTIAIGDSDYEPDAIVRRGTEELPETGLSVPDPIILVEVLSPNTRRTDLSQKLADYFLVSSVQHYLILFADRVRAIHHRRSGDRIETRVLADGAITFDPPGLTVPLAAFYPARPPRRGT